MEPKHGYVVDASYAHTCLPELSPSWLNYVRALNGFAQVALDRRFAYLELGCGFGHSTVVNAAAFPAGQFHACELNPVHVEGGRRYASALGLENLEFHETSFQELRLSSLPSFDFIVMHGVYSWVDAETRAAIRRIIRDRLSPGGLVYVSYNCMPGWASELPLRRMMVEIAASAPGNSAQRMDHAVRVLTQLSGLKFRFFETLPSALRAIEAYNKVSSNYLVHEFLNDAWEPFYSVDVADEMAAAGLAYVGSATLADNHPMLAMSEATLEAVTSLATPRQQQLAMDFATDRRFRRDVFVEGAAPRSDEDVARTLATAVIGSIDDPRFIERRVQVPRGAIGFEEDFIRELRTVLTGGSTTIADAVSALGGRGRNPKEITRNLSFLVAGGSLKPFAKAQRGSTTAQISREQRELVERTLAYCIETRTARAVPSQVLGNGVLVTPLEALALTERLGGIDSAPRLSSRLEERIGELELDVAPVEHAREVATRVIERLFPSFVRLGLVTSS